MYSRILVAVESNEFTDEFIKTLDQFIYTEFTVVRLLHVIEPIEKTLSWPSEAYKSEAEALLSDIAKKMRLRFAGVMVEEIILEGRAVDAIIDDAIAWEADLIITGAHGKRGPSRFLIGSVASRVASHAPCSVMIIRPAHVLAPPVGKMDSISAVAP